MTSPRTDRADHAGPVRMTGIGRVLVVVYAIMALAATGRSFVQIVQDFAAAPLAYSLSALAAVVYVLATVALVKSDARRWYVIAWIAICFELAGVVVVGTLSLTHPELFLHDATVWSGYGFGYFWVPLALPFVGLWWLRSGGRGWDEAADAAASGAVGGADTTIDGVTGDGALRTGGRSSW